MGEWRNLVDAQDLKSWDGNVVRVQIPPSPPLDAQKGRLSKRQAFLFARGRPQFDSRTPRASGELSCKVPSVVEGSKRPRHNMGSASKGTMLT